MKAISRAGLSACLVLAPVLGGCAHDGAGRGAPTAETPASDEAQPVPGQAKRPTRVLVTGSRIPRPVEPGAQEPATDAPVRVYSRERIDSTGRDGDLGSALQTLDPSVTIRR